MAAIREEMEELRRQLEKGAIQKAYRALIRYMMGLRTELKTRHPEFAVSGLYQGYLDMTYFALFPPGLQARKLKIAIVFNYDAFGFEAWLSGSNRKVQQETWELFKDGQWPGYRVVAPGKGIDSILECDLVTEVDLDDKDALTARIETTTLAFIDDIERFLAEQPPS